MIRRRFAPCIPALALLLLAGCGGGKAAIEGNVTLDGAPIDGGSIAFVPEGGTASSKQVSAEIKGGKYALPSERGPAPGKYKVEILWNKATGKQIQNQSDPGTMMDETKQVVPDNYNKKTSLTVEIKSGTNKNVNFDLKGGITSGPGGGGQKAAGD